VVAESFNFVAELIVAELIEDALAEKIATGG
jgi:hypothetical protein